MGADNRQRELLINWKDFGRLPWATGLFCFFRMEAGAQSNAVIPAPPMRLTRYSRSTGKILPIAESGTRIAENSTAITFVWQLLVLGDLV